MSVAGSIVTRLGFEGDFSRAKAYEQALDRTDRKSKQLAATSTRMGAAISGAMMAGVTAAIGAVQQLGAAMVRGVVDAAKYGDEIGKTSAKLGMSTRDYQLAEQVAGKYGTSVEAVGKAQRTLTRTIDAARSGSKVASQDLRRLGLTSEQLAAATPIDRLAMMADALGRIEDPTQRAMVAQRTLGKAAIELGPMMQAGGSGIRDMAKRAEDLGIVLDESVIRGSEDLQDSLQDLRAVQRSAMAELAGAFAPLVSDAARGMADWLAANRGFIREDLPGYLRTAADGVRAVGETIGNTARNVWDFVAPVVEAARSVTELEVVSRALGAYMEYLRDPIGWVRERVGWLQESADALGSKLGQIPVVGAALEGYLSRVVRPFGTLRDAIAGVIAQIEAFLRRFAALEAVAVRLGVMSAPEAGKGLGAVTARVGKGLGREEEGDTALSMYSLLREAQGAAGRMRARGTGPAGGTSGEAPTRTGGGRRKPAEETPAAKRLRELAEETARIDASLATELDAFVRADLSDRRARLQAEAQRIGADVAAFDAAEALRASARALGLEGTDAMSLDERLAMRPGEQQRQRAREVTASASTVRVDVRVDAPVTVTVQAGGDVARAAGAAAASGLRDVGTAWQRELRTYFATGES